MLAAALVSCATVHLPEVSDADVERAHTIFPDATRASLEAGRQTFSLRCGRCHEPYEPSSRTSPEWEQAVAIMSPRAGLTAERQRLVLQYVQTFAHP